MTCDRRLRPEIRLPPTHRTEQESLALLEPHITLRKMLRNDMGKNGLPARRTVLLFSAAFVDAHEENCHRWSLSRSVPGFRSEAALNPGGNPEDEHIDGKR
jgi:hypothetical protein